MGHYVSRDFVCDRLRLGERQSYRLLPSCYRDLINTDEMLALLNRARRPVGDPFLSLPSDIVTAEELAASPELDGSGVTARDILRWARRRAVRIPPHFYINKHTVRFSRSRFFAWLDAAYGKRRDFSWTVRR